LTQAAFTWCTYRFADKYYTLKMFGGDKRSSLLIPTVSDEKSFIILTSSGNPNLKGRPSTLDLLVLTSLDQLLLI